VAIDCLSPPLLKGRLRATCSGKSCHRGLARAWGLVQISQFLQRINQNNVHQFSKSQMYDTIPTQNQMATKSDLLPLFSFSLFSDARVVRILRRLAQQVAFHDVLSLLVSLANFVRVDILPACERASVSKTNPCYLFDVAGPLTKYARTTLAQDIPHHMRPRRHHPLLLRPRHHIHHFIKQPCSSVVSLE